MDSYIENIKAHLTQLEPESVMEMLYGSYREQNRPEPRGIQENFAYLNDILGKLPLREMDEVWYRICDLCTEYQKMAFTDGVGVGAKLMQELETQ